MNRRDNHNLPLPHDGDDVFAELSRPASAPDLTRSIMGRLGYMQVDPAIARRHRRRRWAARGAVVAMMLMAIGGGIAVFNQSDAVRRQHEVTIPSAIGQDVQQHQQRFNTFIRVLQSSTPQHETPHLSPFVPVSTDEADMTRPEIEFERYPAHENDRLDEPAHDGIDEVEYPAIAHVRWV